MDIGDVPLAGAGDGAFGHGMAGAEHHIIALQVELLDRDGHQLEVVAEALFRQGQALDKAGARGAAMQEMALRLGQEIAEHEEIRRGEGEQHLFQHAFAAGIAVEPFMDDGDFCHASCANCSRRAAAAGQE